MIELIAHNLAPIMFASLVAFLLHGLSGGLFAGGKWPDILCCGG